MGYLKDGATIVGAGLFILMWMVFVLASAAVPVALVWYLVTH